MRRATEFRIASEVACSDGAYGELTRVVLVIDPADHHVTHILLDEAHLWGKKSVAIPISAVKDVDDGVRLTLTKEEVRDLPPVDLAEPA